MSNIWDLRDTLRGLGRRFLWQLFKHSYTSTGNIQPTFSYFDIDEEIYKLRRVCRPANHGNATIYVRFDCGQDTYTARRQ